MGYSDGTYYYTPDDWYDEIFGSSFRQEYNASVSGKSDKISYYASAGYLNDTGLIQNSAFKRYTGRGKVDYQAKKWLKIGTNLAYTYSDSQVPDNQTSDDWASSGNLFFIVNSIAPIYPMYVRNPDGSIKINATTGHKTYDAGSTTNFSRPSFTGNAARDIELNRYHTYTDAFSGNGMPTSLRWKDLPLQPTLQPHSRIHVRTTCTVRSEAQPQPTVRYM